MNRETPVVTYDQFFFLPIEERLKIFNEITAENRASIVKIQSERWLAANRSRLTHQQVAVVEEMVQAISPLWYETERDFETGHEAEALINKVQGVLSREDIAQLATRRANYIPIKHENG